MPSQKIHSRGNSFLLLVILLFPYALFSQKGTEDGSRFGHGKDSLECLKNVTLYRDFMSQSDYVGALPYWKKAFNDCPYVSKNLYIEGVKLMRFKLDNNLGKREDLIDTIVLIYDRRIECFGETGEIRGRQGADLLRYSNNDEIDNLKKAYGFLKKSIDIEKDNSSEAVLASYISVALNLYKKSALNAGEVITDYLIVSEIISSYLKTNEDNELQNLKKNIDGDFVNSGPDNCDTLTAFLCDKLNSEDKDINLLNSLIKLLLGKDCSKTTLLYDCAKRLYNLSPSSESAQNLAIIAYNNTNYEDAIYYYKKAANFETDSLIKAEYYYNLAIILNKTDNKPKARDYAQMAASFRRNWGDPYLLIGQIYAESKELCETSGLPGAVYWAAVDMFIKAKTIDPMIEERADNLIQTYSKYYPDKEQAFFKNITEGKTYTIGCWINETTKARFNN